MKRIICSFLMFNLLSMPVLALEFDTSIDEEIRKNYNPSKIEQDNILPALPKAFYDTKQTNPRLKRSNVKNINQISSGVHKQTVEKNVYDGNYIILKIGTNFKLRLVNTVSDRSQKGSKVSFVSLYPVTTTYFTIPMGTTFRGEILSSHGPQFSGNGGLIAMSINSIVFRDEVQPINASVTKVNSKMVFFNNIKGKRKYISSMVRSMKPGCHFFGKMMHLTVSLANDGSSIVLAPFSLFAGVTAVCANVLISPSVAMFYKGGPVSIREGSIVEVKLLQDVFIYN